MEFGPKLEGFGLGEVDRPLADRPMCPLGERLTVVEEDPIERVPVATVVLCMSDAHLEQREYNLVCVEAFDEAFSVSAQEKLTVYQDRNLRHNSTPDKKIAPGFGPAGIEWQDVQPGTCVISSRTLLLFVSRVAGVLLQKKKERVGGAAGRGGSDRHKLLPAVAAQVVAPNSLAYPVVAAGRTLGSLSSLVVVEIGAADLH